MALPLRKKTSDYVVIPAKAGIHGLKKTSADRPILMPVALT
jgi:hypothetical protein